MKTYELQPTSNQKSFGQKAFVQKNDGCFELLSYGVKVAIHPVDSDIVEILGWYSNTTQKHINAFLESFGFRKVAKKEIQENDKLRIKK